MQYLFYDTSALLDRGISIFESKEIFFISSITLKELEHIKNSAVKDQELKYKARRLIELLISNKSRYHLVMYSKEWDEQINNSNFLPDNNDSRIIISAKEIVKQYPEDEIVFATQDLCCREFAAAAGLKIEYIAEDDAPYKGWIEVQANDNFELEKIYNLIYGYEDENPFHLIKNQYLFLKDPTGAIIDTYKCDGKAYLRVPDFYAFNSQQFGRIKPKDPYQLIAMDSLSTNKLTVLRGPAGSGKSYLSMAYLLQQREQGKIDKIIIFCNTIAARGAAKLGFYPGDKDEKLLDSQIGNFLGSKFGDKLEVERLISQGIIVLLPMADIRGFDTTGMKAGIYITEAQNLDIELMRLALQRIGDDCFCILDGDSDAQVDASLYAGHNNGLRRVSKVFRGEDIYGEVTLPNIYRSRIANIAQKV